MRRRCSPRLRSLPSRPPRRGAATLQPVGTFSSPTYVTSDPTDPNRLFVVQQGGTIQLSDHGVVSQFLDIHTQVATGGERGLLSMALAPDYASTGHFYVYYTAAGTGAVQIDEYTAAGNSASAATRRPILTIPHPGQANHNGGQLQFGPDGYLYLATGDGGGGNDQLHNAQDTSSLLGKLLRIDPATGTGPPGNPFAGGGGRSEIWAIGLRNPFRFSFDRTTGALLIGDVGQGSHEEVDYVPQPNAGRGLNFGWSCREGFSAFATTDPLCASASGFTNPIFDYPTHSNGRCAIVGGYVARDQSLGDLYGRYLYSDNCGGEIRSLVPALPLATGDRSEGLSVSGPASFGQDSCGRLYITSLGTGEVSRFVGGAPDPCSSPSNPPAPPPTCGGKSATRVAGSGARIDGSPGDDVIVADRRDNRIKAGGGDDIVCGLDGDDVIKGGSGKDRLRGGHGDDRCVGGRKDKLRSC